MQEKNITSEQSNLLQTQPQTQTQTQDASCLSQLNTVIESQANTLQAGQSLTISLQPLDSTLTLTGNITPINTSGSVTIQPSGTDTVTLDGSGSYPGFVVMSGTVILNDLNIQNMKSTGAPGSMGAGGGLLIANLTDSSGYTVAGCPSFVTLSNVNFSNCIAQGGAGSTSTATGGSGGSGGGREGGGQGGQGGSNGASPSGNGLFGGPAAGGCFGVMGAGGDGGDSGGGGGAGSNTSDPFASPGNGHPGGAGDAGDAGGNGGYGAAGGAGGAGGGAGGGGGGGEQFWAGEYANGGPGGQGGNGANAGAPGFGGGQGCSGGTGSEGQGPQRHNCGGDGGPGAPGGAASGGGAGFGGAIFVMDNATLQFNGTALSIAGCQAIGGAAASGGTNGAGAGAGIFLHGSGTLQLAPYGTLTISDPIVDEAGSGIASVPSGFGPDNLPYSGGDGVWGVSISGGGTVVLQGQQAFSGQLTVSNNTTLDLSDCVSLQANSISIETNASLIQKPKQPMQSPIQLKAISLGYIADFSLNGYSSIAVESLTCPSGTATEIQLNLDQTGFTPGKPVTVLQSNQSLPTLTVQVNNGFTYNIEGNSISITMSQS
jgi:hypothetical protein